MTLTIDDGSRLLILPDRGFRVVGWIQPDGTEIVAGHRADLATQRPTRSGIPVLFPWPNRMVDGRFPWQGGQWSVPCNRTEDGRASAIHGLAVAAPWRWTADAGSITGTYRLPPGEWPGEGDLTITYALAPGTLTMTAHVVNTGNTDLPFGLGFHPYFTALGADSVDETRVRCPARAFWPLSGGVPTGSAEPVSGPLELSEGREVGDHTYGDALTDLPPTDAAERFIGSLAGPAGLLEIHGSHAWRDVVVFTTDDRSSMAIEPYTCPTNAANMPDPSAVGWQTLPPGQQWSAQVTYRFVPGQV